MHNIRTSINSVISEFDHTLKMNGYTVKQNDDSKNISLSFCHEKNKEKNFSISFLINLPNKYIQVIQNYPENGRISIPVPDEVALMSQEIKIPIENDERATIRKIENYLREFIEKNLRKSN